MKFHETPYVKQLEANHLIGQRGVPGSQLEVLLWCHVPAPRSSHVSTESHHDVTNQALTVYKLRINPKGGTPFLI